MTKKTIAALQHKVQEQEDKAMKKGLKISVTIILLLTGTYFGVKWFFSQPCQPPDKPSQVPAEAVWLGGCDGGSWMELVSIEKDQARFRVYRDWNGDLILDADFEYKDCNEFRLTESNWSKCIGDFINGNIGVYVDCNENIKCRLEPIYPAHYEEPIE